MSENLPAVKEFSPQDLQLIKDTVAKGATDAEFQLFMYRAKSMGLNPLRPGQIYFVKFGSSPGQIIIGLDGFRSIASKTGKHMGTRRGTTHDKDGKLVGGWAEVSKSGWSHPARADVSLAEYTKNQGEWKTKPETMIQKVAEVSALRMAFPDELGGVYGEEERPVQEIAQREPAKIPQQVEDLTDSPAFEADMPLTISKASPTSVYPDNYVFQTGGAKRKGKEVKSLSPEQLTAFTKWFEQEMKDGKEAPQQVEEDFDAATAFLLSL